MHIRYPYSLILLFIWAYGLVSLILDIASLFN